MIGPKNSMLAGIQAGCVAVALAAGGAALPWFMMGDGYASHASIRLEGTGSSTIDVKTFASNAMQQLLSVQGLDRLATDLKLNSGHFPRSAESGELGLLWDLLTGKETPRLDEVAKLQRASRRSIGVVVDPETDQLKVSVTAVSPDAARQISEYVAQKLVAIANTGGLAPAMQPVNEARSRLDKAEAALTGFQMRIGNSSVSRMQDVQQRRQEAALTVASIENRVRQIGLALDKANALKPQDMFAVSMPSDAAFGALADIQQKYAAAKIMLAEVSVDHGTRHPRVIAANQVLSDIEATAAPTLKRIVADLKVEETSARDELAAATKARQQLQTEMDAFGTAPIELAALEKGLERARSEYLQALDSNEGQAAKPTVIAFVSQKASSGQALRDNSLVMSGGAAGAFLGLLFAVAMPALRRRPEEFNELDLGDVDLALPADNGAELEVVVSPPETTFEPVLAEADERDLYVPEPFLADDSALLNDNEEEPAPEHATPDYADAANDVPLDVLVRQILMNGRVRRAEIEEEAPLPSLLEAALQGRFVHQDAESEELRAVRQEMAALREQLHDYTARKVASGR